MEIFSVKNLSFTYPDCEKPTLENISFNVESGDFITLCAPTGGGKSTLLRLLKNELSPLGDRKGNILFCGKNIEDLSISESAQIGFVLQNPELQTVTDKVWHEIAFGLENMRMPQAVIRRRIAEIMCYFGIEHLFEKNTAELSGGQKQLIALASVTAMQPKVIILDEPTSQLDPISASDFLSTLKKLNTEQGITVILSEHRIENAISQSNKLMLIDEGKLIAFDTPEKVCSELKNNSPLFNLMPAAAKIFSLTKGKGVCPLSIKDGKSYVEKNFSHINSVEEVKQNYIHSDEKAVELKNIRFRYTKSAEDVLRDTSLSVYKNEIMCILGGNGSGKTTMLNVCSGFLKPYYGKIEIFGKDIKKYKGQSLYNGCLSILPQNVQTVFLKNTLEEEFAEVNAGWDIIPFDLSYAAKTHPYDLSGGEQQLAALAKVLASKPSILLLDEPTKGLDFNAKENIANILIKLRQNGLTIISVTHDVDFAAMCADRCAMFFRGEITCIGTPEDFFSTNSFYTTPANKIMRNKNDKIITCSQAADFLNGK